MNDRIDELAKSMASNQVTRRSAFRRILGAIFGVGAMAALPSRASAQTEPGLLGYCLREACSGLSGMDQIGRAHV